MRSFALPDLGEGLAEAEIVSWHVSTGDHVVEGQPLVSVETAKAVVEIPSPQAGRVQAIHGKPGDVVKIGTALADFEETASATALVGEIPEEAKEVKISPALRARAHQLGIDLTGIKGTGPGGAISSADLEEGASGQVIELRGARRTMAVNMARARDVVPATLTEEADVTRWPQGVDVTVKLVRAVTAAVAAEPRLNAWYDAGGQTLRLHARISLGLAQDTPDGLLVPTLRLDAALEDQAMRQEINRLKSAALARKLAPSELSGQTITLSNFGMIAGLHAALVVMPPQVAIIGAGRIVERTGIRLLPLSLTFDHRALSGGEAARFMKALARALETGNSIKEDKPNE